MPLLDSAGRPVPTKVIWWTSSFFLASPAPEQVVGLPAGTPPITADRPGPGHAYIPMTWNDVLDPCSAASLLRVPPPPPSPPRPLAPPPPAAPPAPSTRSAAAP